MKVVTSVVVFVLAVSVSAQWLDGVISLPDSFGYLRFPNRMVENPLTGRLYVESGSGVMVIDGTTGEKFASYRWFDLPVYCAGAERLCIFRGDSAVLIDARADTVVGTADFQLVVHNVIYSPLSRKLYSFPTRSYPVRIEVLDVAAGAVVGSFEYEGWLHEALWDTVTNRVFFTAGEDSSGVLVLDCAGDSFVGRVWYEWHEAAYIALDSDLRKLYLSCGVRDTIIIIDPDSLVELSRVFAPAVHQFELVEDRSHRLFYGHDTATVIVDCRADTVRAVLEGIDPYRLACDRATGDVFIALHDRPGVVVVDTNDNIDRWLLEERGHEIVSLALAEDASMLYAGLALDTLFFVEPQTGAVEEIVVAPYLRVAHMVHNPAGNELYAFCHNKDVVAVIGPDRQVSGFIEGLPYQSDANAILNPVLNRLYVGDDSTLWVVDCNTKQVISTHELPYYDEMAFVLLADRGRLYVFPRNTSGTLEYAAWVYDCWADEMVARIGLPAETPDAVYHPAADLIYFCVEDTPSVRVLDPQTNTVVQTINAGRTNRRDRLAVDLDRNRVYHSCYQGSWLIVIDAPSATVLDSVDLERPVDTLVMNHEQDKLYLLRLSSSGRFYIYDCLGDSLLPEKDYDPDYVALLNPRNDKLYFEGDNGLRIIDCRNDSLVGDWPEGRGVRYMAWNAIDNLVYASRASSDIYVFADDPTGVEEMPNAEGRMRNATIVRGMLPMTGRKPAMLLDITGRRVLDLLPGENDVSGLSPGVYFVRRDDEVSSVRKVVIQR